MTPLSRRSLAVGFAALACVLPSGSAQAAAGDDNFATAINQTDNSRVFDFAWDINRKRGDDPVLHINKAESEASCTTNCEATAIAFQIVLVAGNPDTVVPQNLARAVNIGCDGCESTAIARQFVRVVADPVRFTGTGRNTLADVREDLEALENQDLDPLQLYAAAETQEARVRDVLNNELVLKSNPKIDADVLERRLFQATDLD